MHDLIIIGGGPAGLTAALYAARARLKTLLLEKVALGGQILLTPTIDNYPGFFEGTTTERLILEMSKQVERLGVEIKMEQVKKVFLGPGSQEFKVITTEAEYKAQSLIIATGAEPKRLMVKGEDVFTGKGVSYCGICDGPLFTDKDILVVGGGNRAIEEAIYLSRYARRVTVVHRRNELRAMPVVVEEARGNPKISFMFDTVLDEITGRARVEGANVKNVKTGAAAKVDCDGVFIFIGMNPILGFLEGQLKTDEFGFIIADEAMATSRQGVFACGDCRKKTLYQVITACGDGAVAADSVFKYLIGKKNK